MSDEKYAGKEIPVRMILIYEMDDIEISMFSGV